MIRSRDSQHHSIRDSVTSLRSLGRENEIKLRPDSINLPRKVQSVTSMNCYGERDVRHRYDRKIATLPRGNVAEIEETITISRRTSINGGIPTGIG